MQARQNSMPPVRHIQNVAQSQIKMSRGQSAKILHYLHLVSVILHFLHCRRHSAMISLAYDAIDDTQYA